jgi:rhamnosyl/mannosyltransferase
VSASAPLKPYLAKTRVVPLGISVEKRENSRALVAGIRNRHPGKKLVFAMGRLVPYKGFDTLVRAARRMPHDVAVLIGGDGPERESLHRLIASEGVNGKVQLLGRLSDADAEAHLDATDVFCLPSVSRAEAFGVVLLEAMRAGKPIVASDIPGSGVGWVNEHGVTGINVPPGDPQAVAAAVANILADATGYHRYCEASRLRFLQTFTRERMVLETLAVVESVI